MIRRFQYGFFFALILSASAVFAGAEPAESSVQAAVLITGASTGLGRAMAERLAEDGYFVYAGARKQQDLDALNAIDNVEAIRLDVTIQKEIDSAVETVRSGDKPLYALINNAGVLMTGPSAETNIDDVEWLFGVNVFGVMRMTRAFAPMLIDNKGRIINIGSIAGSVGFGFLGPYSMSKHAMEAYTESLYTELAPLGVSVSVIKPGDYASDIWKSDGADQRVSEMRERGSPYADAYRAWLDEPYEVGDPLDVADLALKALSDKPMAKRYLIVPNETEMAWVMDNLVDRLADLNRNNELAWTPDRIARDLEAAIASKESESR